MTSKITQIGRAPQMIDLTLVDERAAELVHTSDDEVEMHIRHEIKEALKDARSHARELGVQFPSSDARGIKLAVRSRMWAEIRRLRQEYENSKFVV